MARRTIVVILIMCILLSGCGSWMDGSYSSVKPHTQRPYQTDGDTVTAVNYDQLRAILSDLVESGERTQVINVAQMDEKLVAANMDRVVQYILQIHPIGAYVVDELIYVQGTNAGQPSVAVNITYNQNLAELRHMTEAADMDGVRKTVANALDQCAEKVVLRVNRYHSMDFGQYVREHMELNPQTVMELPQVTVRTFPETGTIRVLEIMFTYQTGRDALKSMQNRVRPLFTSAELYVSGSISDYDKYAMLCSFLMERHEYQLDPSITPAYSLLIHGVGDSRAFATVYAAMCRRAGLECSIVSGTGNGEPLFWNMIRIEGQYHHLDLLEWIRSGVFAVRGDEEMDGYVWDYSAYPQCEPYVDPTAVTEPTEPEPDTTEATEAATGEAETE